MGTISKFQDLESWQLARQLSKEIFELSQQGKFARDFDLKNQINRSSGSTMDNIAEGFGRGGRKEFIHFLTIARGSNSEATSQLFRAFDRNYISEERFDELMNLAVKVGVKISNFLTYLYSSPIKGSKFQQS